MNCGNTRSTVSADDLVKIVQNVPPTTCAGEL
jgi:hypothetical protein